MTSSVFSFLDTLSLSPQEIESLFARAKEIKSRFLNEGRFPLSLPPTSLSAMIFFEPSTRTRLSFEIAVQRLGGRSCFFDGASKEGSSLIKGETLEDTFWTLHSMLPDVMIIRCGDDFPLHRLAPQSKIPIINAGYGTQGHPTQALLDTFTMLESFSSLQGKKVLFVGDIRHSRVARSHMELLPRLGAEMGVVGPEIFLQGVPSQIRRFTSLQEALSWADVCMGLRVQLERHAEGAAFSREEFIKNYQLRKEHGQWLRPDALLFHPGPVNWGMELDPSVRELPQFKMWDQKQNGVFVRAALVHEVLQRNGKVPHV